MVSQVRGGCWNKNNCPLLRRSWALLVGCKVNVGVKRPAIGLAGLARPERSLAFLDGLCCYPAGDDDGLDGLDWVGPEIVRARDMGLVNRRAWLGWITHHFLPPVVLCFGSKDCLLDCVVPAVNLASL